MAPAGQVPLMEATTASPALSPSCSMVSGSVFFRLGRGMAWSAGGLAAAAAAVEEEGCSRNCAGSWVESAYRLLVLATTDDSQRQSPTSELHLSHRPAMDSNPALDSRRGATRAVYGG